MANANLDPFRLSCTRSDKERTSMVSLRSVAIASSGWPRSMVRNRVRSLPRPAAWSARCACRWRCPSIADSSPKLSPAWRSRKSISRPVSEIDGHLEPTRRGRRTRRANRPGSSTSSGLRRNCRTRTRGSISPNSTGPVRGTDPPSPADVRVRQPFRCFAFHSRRPMAGRG